MKEHVKIDFNAKASFLDVILIVNTILKFFKLINWNWLLILWPLWAELGILAIILITFGIVKRKKDF